MLATPIVLVEDRGVLGLTISDYLRHGKEALEPYGLNGAVQLVASVRGLRKWLEGQPPQTVRLMLLDFSIIGGTGTALLSLLRDPASGRTLHPALHPDALVIGWSAEPDTAHAFQVARADGFISKHRPVPQIVTDILTIARRRRAGEVWIDLPPTIG